MLTRFFHTILVFAAVAGYAADAVAYYAEQFETHCSTEHGSTLQDSHQDCRDCVCHMPADVSPEVLYIVFLFDEIKVTKEFSPTYHLVTPPDLQPPRLS